VSPARSSRLAVVAVVLGALLTVGPAVTAAIVPATVQAEVIHYRPATPIAHGPSIHF
jgi:hypothetical protein